MNNTPEFWIEKLKLQPHPEGDYYRETYRCSEVIPHNSLPKRYTAERSFATAIYFLLKSNQVSAFHRIQSDEQWHFYQGSSVEVYIITHTGQLQKHTLGTDVDGGDEFQLIIPFGCWFAARVPKPDSFALVGCCVSPGFDFHDFELADAKSLLEHYPQHSELIRMFNRKM